MIKRMWVIVPVFVLMTWFNATAQSKFNEFFVKGNEALEKREYDKALSFYATALEDRPERLLRSKEDLNILFQISEAHSEKAEYQNSLKFLYKYLEKPIVKTDSNLMARAYNRIGINFKYMGETQKALDNYFKSVKYMTKDPQRLAGLYNNIAGVYIDMQKVDTAQLYYTKSYDLFKTMGDNKGLVTAAMNLGLVEMELKHMENALSYFTEARKISQQTKDTVLLLITHINLGDYYTAVTDFENAARYLAWAEVQSKKINGLLYINETYKSIYKMHKAAKNFASALSYLELHKQTNDSINASNLNREFAEMEAKYRIRETEKENEDLKNSRAINELQLGTQRKYIWTLSGLAIFMLVFIAVFYLQRRNLTNSKRMLEEQHKALSKSEKQLQDLNFQYERLINKYEGQSEISFRDKSTDDNLDLPE